LARDGGQRTDSNGQPAADGKRRRITQPTWDGKRLKWGAKTIKAFRRAAPDQMALLQAFQDRGWPRQIDAAQVERHGGNVARLARNTVHNLNCGLERIEFHLDGTKHGIYWVERD
jgi:hypothetical protein